MRKGKQIILTILISCALLALTWAVSSNRSTAKMIEIVVASRDIPAGSMLAADQLEMVKVQESDWAARYYTSISQAVGLWTAADIPNGEMISRSRMESIATGLQYPKPGPGRRLLTLDMDPADANGFWLSAGSLVDLYLIPKNRVSATDIQILENIRIMAVLQGDSSQKVSGVMVASPTKSGLVCLDLNNEQARLIIGSLGLYEIRLTVINELPAESA